MKPLLCVLFLFAASSLAADRPNVLLILADDMGWGDARCYNAQSKIPTPHLDRIAAEGVRFTDAHTPSSVCTPTRYGLLTGRYAWRTWLKKGVLDGFDPPLIEPGRATHQFAQSSWGLLVDLWAKADKRSLDRFSKRMSEMTGERGGSSGKERARRLFV